jgi:enoyl-CoA hydratase
MDYQTLAVDQDGPVVSVRLNRPECLNAVNHVMRDELADFFGSRAATGDFRVIVLSGAGRGFCAGLDLRDETLVRPGQALSPRRAYEAQRGFSQLILLMRRCPQPIVAAVGGAACGAGLSFAMASDIRLASPAARFQAAYINLGVGGADLGASWLLPRAIGSANAARYLLSGDFMSAEEALRLGMVQGLVEPDRLLDEAMALGRTLASKSPLGLRLTKEALEANAGGVTLEQAIALEDRNQAMCIAQLTAGESR